MALEPGEELLLIECAFCQEIVSEMINCNLVHSDESRGELVADMSKWVRISKTGNKPPLHGGSSLKKG